MARLVGESKQWLQWRDQPNLITRKEKKLRSATLGSRALKSLTDLHKVRARHAQLARQMLYLM